LHNHDLIGGRPFATFAALAAAVALASFPGISTFPAWAASPATDGRPTTVAPGMPSSSIPGGFVEITPDRPLETDAAELLELRGTAATTWSLETSPDLLTPSGTHVLQLTGPVQITLDEVTLTAASAVVWITPERNSVSARQRVQIALIGNAELTQGSVSRSGPQLLVTASVRGDIRVIAPQRVNRDESNSLLYRAAASLRPESDFTTETLRSALLQRPTDTPTKREITTVDRGPVVRFRAQNIETVLTPEDKTAVILTGEVNVIQTQPDGSFVALSAQRAVLYTTAKSLTSLDPAAGENQLGDTAEAVYLEGDVRVVAVEGSRVNENSPTMSGLAEQRLAAERVYFNFADQQAVLTDAVLHTIEPGLRLPVVVRAQTLRQLSTNTYRGQNVEVSTSSFATPSYSLKAREMYIRPSAGPAGEPASQDSSLRFEAQDTTLRAYGVPFVYLPKVAGTVGEIPLRALSFESSDRFGTGFRSTWGLYDLTGQKRPENVDLRLQLDYLSDRGPAVGVDADYRGGFITDNTRDPWNFTGEVRSYLIRDGTPDDFGDFREPTPRSNELRGRFLWQHQHFFPEDWQAQIRVGYLSDTTFLEQYFEESYNNDLPYETALYLKRQRESEALTFLGSAQINDFVTTNELVAEQFFVERLPEASYRRIGESLLNDRLTLFSDNSVSRLRFNTSGDSLADQGLNDTNLSPGIPAIGSTGVDTDATYRADFRQEFNAPVTMGQFKVVPYAIARYTPYSDSPEITPDQEGGTQNRVYGAVGTRVNTAFWKIDDTAHSETFDIHRLRHVIEPSANVYASGTTVDRTDVFIYDEDVDGIHDISGANVALRQRWQTKRGGPGRWRNVDFVTLNVEGNAFYNQPDEDALRPNAFRGLFFGSSPESSIPRNSVNADATWRVSDATAIITDTEWNADESEIATAAIALVVRRDPRLSYYVGTRYIEELTSNISTVAASYQLTAKYTLGISQSYDFSDNENVSSGFSVIRRFDRFFAILRIYNDSVNDESGFRISIAPEGFGPTGPAGVGALANSVLGSDSR
jgi:hypothetical protein